MNIQTLWCENHLEDGDTIMLTQSQSSTCVKTELAQMNIWQWTCIFVQLNCCHIVPPGDITHTAFTLFITHLHRMPEHMQNSRHSNITTSFLTCTTFIPLHLLLFLLPPVKPVNFSALLPFFSPFPPSSGMCHVKTLTYLCILQLAQLQIHHCHQCTLILNVLPPPH